MKETPGQTFAVVKGNMVWEKPSVHNPPKVKGEWYLCLADFVWKLKELVHLDMRQKTN